MSNGPAYRVETARLVLRCADPRDAGKLDEAIRVSVDHLRPWMEWAHREPQPLQARVELLRQFRAAFDSGRDFFYAVFSADESEFVGASGLHTRQGAGTREVGYWIRADRLKRGFATEVAAALTKVAFEVDGVRRVEIRCDTENALSRRIPRRLGFEVDGVLKQKAEFMGSVRDDEIWSLVASAYAGSEPSRAVLRAYDAIGEPLLRQ